MSYVFSCGTIETNSEGQKFGKTDVRTVQDCAPQGGCVRSLHQPSP